MRIDRLPSYPLAALLAVLRLPTWVGAGRGAEMGVGDGAVGTFFTYAGFCTCEFCMIWERYPTILRLSSLLI